MYVDMSKTIN